MVKKKIVKLKNESIRAIVVVFALFLITSGLGGLGVFTLPAGFDSLALTLASVMVIFFEIGIVNIFSRSPKLDLLSGIGVTAALVLLITVILEMFGLVYPQLEGIRGLVFLVVGGSFLIETFMR